MTFFEKRKFNEFAKTVRLWVLRLAELFELSEFVQNCWLSEKLIET